MKKIYITLLSIIFSSNVYAETIDFEDYAGLITNPFTQFPAIGDNYKGLDWNNGNNISAVNINPYLVPGVDYTGLNNIAIFNDFGASPSYIDSASDANFNFNQGFWSSQFGNSQVQFEGWNNGVQTYTSEIFDINASSVLLISLNWLNIDRLVINSTSLWIADNLDITATQAAIPIPAGFWLFGSALLGFAGFRRKNS